MRRKKIFSILSVIVLVALVIPVGVAGQTPQRGEITNREWDRPLREVPQEIQDMFKDGMSIDEFLSRYDGPIPNALMPYTDKRVNVIVQLAGDPLAAVVAASQAEGKPMTGMRQKTYARSLASAQESVANSLRGMGGTVISQYRKAYNGILVNIEASRLKEVRALPGVVAVRRAPEYYVNLGTSVPLINADDVWNISGYTGAGVTIAVIDTGIDYTHAALGGSGNPADYSGNDPDIIEPGTFPTAKVIGGYDFAGTNYDASGDVGSPIPVPDPDPLDENGHGTHVSSTAAGIGVTGVIGQGVAPDALLYALKVFGADGTTNLTVDAIEWAMDPNGDDDLSDHVDVINMSLGSRFGPADPNDPDIFATDLASAVGIMVVASAGNEGNSSYIVGSPGTASTALSVAASTTGWDFGPTINISNTAVVTWTNIIYMPPAFDGNTGHFTSQTEAPLYYVGNIPGAPNDELCSTAGLPTNVLTGTLALIQRGSCAFSDKVNNAAALGAVGAIIFNHASGGDSLVTMVGSPVSIPAGFIGHTNGVNLSSAHGMTAVVSAETDRTTVPSSIPADTIADFSSRGPRGYDSFLKPEITAPGVSIFAAAMGSGNDGVSFSGTSMAAPHVAGVAALIREAHPSWTPEMVKAAMMNTAVDLADADSMEVPRQGAGRVDAFKAVNAETVAGGDPNLVSLSWGYVESSQNTYMDTKSVRVKNVSSTGKIFSIDWEFGSYSFTAGFDLILPEYIFVSAGSLEDFDVALNLDMTQVPVVFGWQEEYYGFVTLTNTSDPSEVLRVPFYVTPRPYSGLDLADDGVFGDINWVELTHHGPQSSSLWVYPAFVVDPNEPSQMDLGDLYMAGMDYGWFSGSYGDIIVAAFDTYGPVYTPQPYMSEIDLYIDYDEDGVDDYVDFNFNLGWWNGMDDTNDFIVVQVDLSAGFLYLGSPYFIYTDFNTGFQEWYLPTGWNSLTSAPSSLNSDFNFFVLSWDFWGSPDIGGGWYFDAYRPPLGYGWTGDPGPSNPVEYVAYWLGDVLGYYNSQPLGLMIVDYYGKPGFDEASGYGQAYFWPFSFQFNFLPFVSKDVTSP